MEGTEFHNKSERELRSTAGVENVSPFHPLVTPCTLCTLNLSIFLPLIHTPSWILVIINAVALYRFFLRVQTFFSSVPFASAANLKQKNPFRYVIRYFTGILLAASLIVFFSWLVRLNSSYMIITSSLGFKTGCEYRVLLSEEWYSRYIVRQRMLSITEHRAIKSSEYHKKHFKLLSIAKNRHFI